VLKRKQQKKIVKSKENKNKTNESNKQFLVEEVLRCPITYEKMKDPVIAADGHTYERLAIEIWLKKHDTSPLTNLRLPHKHLVPNYALKALL